MDRIQTQASKLWDLLFAEETADTYQNAFNLTGTLLKESAQLIWLVICSFFVFGAWFSDATMKTGKSLRDWIDQLGNESSTPADQKPIAETGKSLLDTGRSGIAYLLAQAREQLGVEPAEPTPTAALAVKPTASPTAASAPVQPASTQPAPTQPAAPSQPTNYAATSEISREASDDGWPAQAED